MKIKTGLAGEEAFILVDKSQAPHPEAPTGAADEAAAAVESQALAGLAFWNQPAPSGAVPAAPGASSPNLSGVCRLSRDPGVVRLAHSHGLSVVDVAWEDTSRAKKSCWGSNITDATLRARDYSERCSIIRLPNFTDHTGDFSIGQFHVRAGNETGAGLERLPLRDYLNKILSRAGGPPATIDASREILVAAQTCVLPLHRGRCEFNVELFNYQTSQAYPACLAVVCSAAGTSAQIISQRGAQSLQFNLDGKACDFFAERLKEVRARENRPLEGAMSAEEEERNMLLILQVPLKIPRPAPWSGPGIFPFGYSSSMPAVMFGAAPGFGFACASAMGASLGGPPPPVGMGRGMAFGASLAAHSTRGVAPPAFSAHGVDHAQLGITEPRGPFSGSPGTARLEIDPDAAIRCTVQHYLASDCGEVSEAEMADVRATMDKIYGQAARQGSLVVDVDAARRSTAPGRENRFWFFAA